MRHRYICRSRRSLWERRGSNVPRAFASLFLLSLLTALPVVLPQTAAFAGPKREGDILRIFDKGRVYIITNEDAALADMFLEGCQQRERRILTPEEWAKQPADLRRFVSAVYLINRERLPQGVHLPERCTAQSDELYQEVMRTAYPTGPTYEVILSAPDAAWLKQGIAEFRRLAEVPRGFRKRNVRSLAVVPSAASVDRAAVPLFSASANAPWRAHLLPAEQYAATTARTADMDELLLLDRSTTPPTSFAPVMESLNNGRTIRPGDTVAWRELKPNGRARVVISGPTADQVADVLRRNPDPLTFAETMTVLNSARDLRAVRRVAVVGVKQGPGDTELRHRLATRAASELRALDAFEVLERAGLSEILSEIALDQAGITHAKDRARVRQMAAADAMLLVEITDIHGRTEYNTKFKRVTPWMAGAPACPSKPSRLKYDLNIADNVRNVAEPILAKVVGTKSDEEFEKDMRVYNREVLPRWQRQLDFYNDERRNREVTWDQQTVGRSSVTVKGSLRLVDLTDGLVLWEAPFTASDNMEGQQSVKSITTIGEDSRPGAAETPKPTATVPETLLARVADTALLSGIQTLRGTALLPMGTAPVIASDTPSATAPVTSGKLLDIDGDSALIGLGGGDGITVGDTLLITVSDTIQVKAMVTRVRPRTCDAQLVLDDKSTLRTRLSAGQVVIKSPK